MNSPGGYLAVFNSDLSKYANRDSIIETVKLGDSIVVPDITKMRANFTVSNTSVCQAGASSGNTVKFTVVSTLLPVATNPGWYWKVNWNFGTDATIVSGSCYFTGTVDNLLSGYTAPTVQWATQGNKDAITGPPKILYVTNVNNGANLDYQDTALVSFFGNYNLPIDYCRTTHVFNLRVAGAKLIVIGPLAAGGAASTWSLLRSINIPLLSLNNSKVDSNGLGLVSSTCCYNVFPADANSVGVILDTLYGMGINAIFPTFDQGDLDPSCNYNTTTVLGTAVRIATLGGGSGGSVFAYHYEPGKMTPKGIAAHAIRAYFGIRNDDSDRFSRFRTEGKALFDRQIPYILGIPYAEINTATVTGNALKCTGNNIKVSFTTSAPFNTNNQFLLELSSPNGVLTDPGYPLLLATQNTTIGGDINFSVPTGLPIGDRYRMRLRSTSPARSFIVTDTTLAVTIDDRAVIEVSSSNGAGSSTGPFNSITWASNFTSTLTNNGAEVGTSFMSVAAVGSTSRRIRYTPRITKTAYYDVQVIYTSTANATSTAGFRIIGALGTVTKIIYQNLNTDRWVSLGSYLFNA